MKSVFTLLVSLFLFASVSRAQTDSAKAARVPQEVLQIDWPAEYNWKVGTDQDNGKMRLVEVVPGSETVENWSIIGSLLAIKGMTNMPMQTVLQGALEQQQKSDSIAHLTVLERNDTAASPWILFKVESATQRGATGKTESDMFFVVQGKTALFNAIVGVHEATLTDDFVSKWKNVFHSSRLSFE